MEPLNPFKGISLQKYSAAETKRMLTEYEDLIARAAKLTKFSYIVTHKRIEKAFDGKPFEHVMSWLRMAVNRSENEKEWPQSKRFNVLLKQYKDHGTKRM